MWHYSDMCYFLWWKWRAAPCCTNEREWGCPGWRGCLRVLFFMQSCWYNDTLYLWEHHATAERTQGAFSERRVYSCPCVIPLITNVQSNNVDRTVTSYFDSSVILEFRSATFCLLSHVAWIYKDFHYRKPELLKPVGRKIDSSHRF